MHAAAARATPAGTGRPGSRPRRARPSGRIASPRRRRRRSARRDSSRPAARRVEDRDDVLAAVAHDAAHRLPVVRVRREALGEDQRSAPRHQGPDLLGRDLHAVDERRRPGAGSCASSRLPSRSTWSQSGATTQPAAIPRPDSIMHPSITPSPSARAACAIRIASRIPPDFASLMLMPCATSRHAATSASVWQSSST